MNWLPVKEYEKDYIVSDSGKVFSLKTAILLKGNIDRYGYLHFLLSKSGSRKHFTAHRLVATHFLENLLNLPQVNHKDGNKLNNDVSNLEWITNFGNRQHAIYSLGYSFKGEDNPSAKLNTESVLKIKSELKNGVSQHSIAKKYKISRSAISMIAINKIWKHI